MSTIYTSEDGARQIRRRYREALDAWPVPAEHLRLPTREGETFVVASGPRDAPPAVLLHGSGTNTAMWRDDVADWSRHFRTYAVDLVGEPGLSAPSRPPLDSDALVLWLDDVLDGLGLTSAALVGASLGGWLALHYTAHRPDRVTRLALLCPGGLGRQKTGWLVKVVLLRPFGHWGTRRSVSAVAGLDAPRHRDALDSVALTFTHFKPRTERLPIFPDDTLRRLTAPVLVLVGARDAMFDSHETARRVRQCVPHATVTVLPDTGHAILGQTAAVSAFLRG
ncbi:alpha/beta fold hydrolase [Marinitenerispora sediminis]|uniref:Alpha/beta hydrolase n=1 Tax=Marinitenerispora sediminis TaxID=1931232 RepID=A0A368SYT5_9ACTN|nr:alpha/beta fold hydrolase [Marinitenerispora sediminis]RCV47690.1 alpha/beta hydrolase [Marinitenerispora sediminis]RCV47997.1 alpha/beta hydrolase [Marinitenerispora sediminis]RCV49641.1 alpha/beta hydrolase [Marinitenerispora sediminis]